MSLVGASQANAVVYNLIASTCGSCGNFLASGYAASLTGSITTDGTIGYLASANILDWNLTATDTNPASPFNVYIFNITKANSVLALSGSTLNATSTKLLFDFGGPSTQTFAFEGVPNAQTVKYCSTGAASCDAISSPAILFGFEIGADASWGATLPPPISNSMEIAAANDSAVPLPAALALFTTGLGALGLLGWRRKRKKGAAIAAA